MDGQEALSDSFLQELALTLLEDVYLYFRAFVAWVLVRCYGLAFDLLEACGPLEGWPRRLLVALEVRTEGFVVDGVQSHEVFVGPELFFYFGLLAEAQRALLRSALGDLAPLGLQILLVEVQEKPSDFPESVALALDLAAVIQNLAVFELMVVLEYGKQDVGSELLF